MDDLPGKAPWVSKKGSEEFVFVKTLNLLFRYLLYISLFKHIIRLFIDFHLYLFIYLYQQELNYQFRIFYYKCCLFCTL